MDIKFIKFWKALGTESLLGVPRCPRWDNEPQLPTLGSCLKPSREAAKHTLEVKLGRRAGAV